MKFRYAVDSQPGNRPENQDYYLVDPQCGIYLVCDGMGGHSGGQTASREATRIIYEELQRHLTTHNDFTPALLGKLITRAITAACRHLKSMSHEHPHLKGMGTTATLIVCHDHYAVMGHVGDSRLYLRRNGKLFQLSHDHTLVNELIDQNILSHEQAEGSPYAHVLTRAVGPEAAVKVDLLQFELLAGDTLLLCSDGFHATLERSETEILELLPEALSDREDTELATILKRMVETTVEKDGSDNTTALLVTVESDHSKRPVELKRRDDVMLEVETLHNLYLFEGLQYNDILRVSAITEVFDVEPKQKIVSQGEKGDTLYLVLRGKFDVIHGSRNIASIEAGSHFGEIALISDTPRSATVVAVEKSRILRIHRDPFEQLLQKFPDIGLHVYARIAKTLANRLMETNAKLP